MDTTIKMEMDTTSKMEPGDLSMEKKRPWEKPGGGNKIKKKKTPGAKNLRVRKYVKPKNAVMCLNDLRSGLVYVTEQEGSVGTPFCISVVVDEKAYRGFGSSKQLAKQAAAEAALISFVQAPVTGGESSSDKTPWVTLASFAIYKLFKEWRESPIGGSATEHVQFLPETSSTPHSMAQTKLLPCPSSAQVQFTPVPKVLSAHLDVSDDPLQSIEATATTSEKCQGVRHPNPAKLVPANAGTMHPVMVLHQMRPGLSYEVNQTTKDNQRFFHMSVVVDEQTFYGEGPTLKKAKFCLARDAINVLFNIESTYDCPP